MWISTDTQKLTQKLLWNNLKPNEQVHWAYEAYIPVSANVKKAEQQWKKEKVADQCVDINGFTVSQRL